MVDRNRWFSRAEPEEEGSFCDAESRVHYQNVSKSEAENLEEETMRRGEGIVSDERPSEDGTSRSQQYNVLDTDVDGQSYDHPSKHGPGR